MKRLFIKSSVSRHFFARLAFALLALIFVDVAHAATCTTKGNGGGEWRSRSTWTCNRTPGSSDTVTILSGDTVSVTRNSSAGSVTVNSGGILEMGQSNNGSSRALTVSGDMIVGGIFRVADTSSGNHTLTVNGSLTVLSGAQFSQQDPSGWGLCEVSVLGSFSNAG